MQARPLQDRVAVVTGAARGIGYAIARRLVDEGARVIIMDVDAEGAARAAAELGGDTGAITADISREADVDRAFAQVVSDAGHLDILVNNAGIVGTDTPVRDLQVADWDQVLNINLKGTFLCSRAAVRHMIPRKSGVIVSMASISGKEGNANMAPYSVSKAGVICFTKSLAKELLEHGIRVNCVAPALIDSPLLAGMEAERVAFLTSRIPMGRLGQPDEVAATVLFLVSDESTFTTGACFDVSGGRATY
ncbi:MAG: SDR family NAD(P)-dependent oxidoreductase [bacterium]|nr:SDR family NAD(P)-dependent oxidoreductase [bacterium]